MTTPIKPQLSTFGDSFTSPEKYSSKSNVLGATDTAGEIKDSKLNVASPADAIEFTKFEESAKNFILSRLGFPVVRVELTPYQLKSAIDEATSKFAYHAPLWTKQMAVMKITAGTNIYELPAHILNNLEYVVYKKSLLSIQAQAGTLEFDFFIKYFQDNFLFNDFAVGDFLLLQQHLEQIGKVLGQEGTWDIVNNKYLQLYPVPQMADDLILEYRAVDSDTIHPEYRNWIHKYALAISKGILGEVRGKYSTLPSPGGGATLNGATLIQQCTEEKKQLEESLFTEMEEPPAFTMF